MTEKKEKWGKIGAPGSKKRKDYLTSIRKNKRNTKQKREARAAEQDKEIITIIESESPVELEVEEDTSPPTPRAKAVSDIIIKERKKMESPGEPGEPYLKYPY